MCGIAGILFNDRERLVTEDQIREMTNSIVHRGPDDEGILLQGNLGFGFRRLSIIDLSTGKQPLSNEDESLWIVFNGEIYNFPELKVMLIAKGHHFKTLSDTEVIIHLFEEFGTDCVKMLRGMFAFAIWDTKNQKLFCARDRFGKKPFFYYQNNDVFIFGSEIKEIYKSVNSNCTIDNASLDYYFAYGYTPVERTIFSEIRKLRPAHWLEVTTTKNGLNLYSECYWRITFSALSKFTETEWQQKLMSVLEESVKLRLISDVPLGAFLSGGLDSSLVVAMMKRYSSEKVKTFSIGFAEKRYNELPYARIVANFLQTDHHEMIVGPQSIELLPKIVDGFDEPFADSSAIPTYFVSKFARENVTVALSGDGGDELFAGYKSYAKLLRIAQKNPVPQLFRNSFFGLIEDLLPLQANGRAIMHYLSANENELGIYSNLWSYSERKKLFNNDFRRNLAKKSAESEKLKLFTSFDSHDSLAKMQGMDMLTYLNDDILVKVDRMSMQNSLEVRCPILDHNVAELSFAMPSNLKLNDGIKKYILKTIGKSYLPAEILTNRKQGFGLPLNVWFRDNLYDEVIQNLKNVNSPIYSYVRKDKVMKLIETHKRGKRDMNMKIWSLLVLDFWLQKIKK